MLPFEGCISSLGGLEPGVDVPRPSPPTPPTQPPRLILLLLDQFTVSETPFRERRRAFVSAIPCMSSRLVRSSSSMCLDGPCSLDWRHTGNRRSVPTSLTDCPFELTLQLITMRCSVYLATFEGKARHEARCCASRPTSVVHRAEPHRLGLVRNEGESPPGSVLRITWVCTFQVATQVEPGGCVRGL